MTKRHLTTLIFFCAFLGATIGTGHPANISIAGDDEPSISNGYPTWSPNAQKIAFVSLAHATRTVDIWTINIDGSNPVNLTAEIEGSVTLPSWSPNGDYIAIEVSQIETSFSERDIWIISPNGANSLNLTSDIDALCTLPQWSPDGNFLAFACDTFADDFMSATGQIWIAESGNFEPENITPTFDKAIFYLEWSPDGNSIAFIANEFNSLMTEGKRQISVVVLENKTVEAITLPGFFSSLSWSPDGEKIATEFIGRDSSDIWLLNLDTGFFDILSLDQIENAQGPTYSPDGRLIAFIALYFEGEGVDAYTLGSDIWLMEADGSNVINLTADESFNSQMRWSPDGQKIAFVSDRDGRTDIWIMNADGSNAYNLTGTAIQ